MKTKPMDESPEEWAERLLASVEGYEAPAVSFYPGQLLTATRSGRRARVVSSDATWTCITFDDKIRIAMNTSRVCKTYRAL